MSMFQQILIFPFLLLKMIDPKGRYTTQSIPAKKKKEHRDKDQSKHAVDNQDADGVSISSSRDLATEKDLEELVTLREQVEDLQRKLLEKDELLKSAEISKNQINVVHTELDELKHQATEKDSLIKSTQLQLYDTKVHISIGLLVLFISMMIFIHLLPWIHFLPINKL